MKAFDELGLFWLPGHEQDALSGRLQVDPKDGGIHLSLVGYFDNAPLDSDNSKLRIVGWRGNDKVTLDQCLAVGTNRRAPGVAESSYYADQMFVGHHFERDELEFRSASVRLSDLDSWVGRSGVAIEDNYPHTETPSHTTYRLNFTPPHEGTCPFSRGRVKLAFGGKPGGDPIRGISFQQWPIIKVEYDQLQAFNTILKDVGRIQNLVTLCIDAPTTIDSLVLRRPDIQAKVLSGEDAGFEQPIEFIARQIRYADPQERQPRHWHQMFLGYRPMARCITALPASAGLLHEHQAREADVRRESLPERHVCR